jgi:hypothetical protein
MAMSSDVLDLLGHERRRSIACAALEEPLTVGEIAVRLNTVDGAIRSIVKRLKDEGLLLPSERPTSRSGSSVTAYVVAPVYAERVRELCQAEQRPALNEGDELLLIPMTSLASAARYLAEENPGVITWAVRTRDPQLSLMIGLRRDSEPQNRDALLIRLTDAGIETRRLYVGESFSPAELFRYAAALEVDTRSVGSLPSRS